MQFLTKFGGKLLFESSGQDAANGVVIQLSEFNAQPQRTQKNVEIYECTLNDGFVTLSAYIYNIQPQLRNSEIKPIIKIVTWETKNSLVLVKKLEIIDLEIRALVGKPIEYKTFVAQGYKNENGSNAYMPKQKFEHQKQLLITIREKKEQKDDVKVKIENSSQKPQFTQQKGKPVQMTSMQTTNISGDTKEVSIKSLYPNLSNFSFKAKLIQKTQIQQFKNGNGHYFNVTLADKEGSRITGSFFNDVCDKFYDTLREGGIYLFKKGIVKQNKYASNKDLPYNITFEKYTEIVEEDDDQNFAPNIKTDWVKCGEIAEQDVGSLVNMMVIVNKPAALQNVNLKSGESKPKKTYRIFDQTGAIEFTLWGTHAQNANFEKGQILSLQGVKVGEYQDTKNVSQIGQTVLVHQKDQLCKINGYEELLNWYEANGGDEGIQIQSMEESKQKNKLSYIEDIETEIQGKPVNFKKFYEIRGVIQAINVSKSPLYYLACNKCEKKVDQASSFCQVCNITAEPIEKYMFSFKVVDDTGVMFVNVYDKHGESIIGKDAHSFSMLSEENKQQTKIAAQNQEIRFLVIAKMEEYNGQPRPRYNFIRKIADDWLIESQEYYDSLKEELNRLQGTGSLKEKKQQIY